VCGIAQSKNSCFFVETGGIVWDTILASKRGEIRMYLIKILCHVWRPLNCFLKDSFIEFKRIV
jgi:hypothetical protein